MEKLMERLYEAALKGDSALLSELLEEDPPILDRYQICQGKFSASPLHVAIKLGHSEFAKKMIERKPHLAMELDSSKSSPLHLSSAYGHLEIVTELLEGNPNMCLARDVQGRNPLHLAAISGQLDILKELVRVKRQAAWERVSTTGETILVNDVADRELLNAKDGRDMNYDIMQAAIFLLQNKRTDVFAVNGSGKTVAEILAKNPNRMEFEGAMKRLPRLGNKAWTDNRRSALMVVASLVAGAAFQAGLNPPGGAWPLDAPVHFDKHIISDLVGSSILASTHPLFYSYYLVCNSLALLYATVVLLMLIGGCPTSRRSGILLTTFLVSAVDGMLSTYFLALYVLKNPESAKGAITTNTLILLIPQIFSIAYAMWLH
ncbi:hypothetical protein Ancab_001979 [Ancistrocladus abbreviatus]